MTRRLPVRAVTALLLLVALAVGASAAGLPDAQKRGKRIYMEGKGRKRITVSLPGAGVRAPGAGFPCVNCHLAGGTGQSEGGVRSADITWFTLTKEYGGPRPSGRTHPPYTDETVRKAITGGVDPAGNVLASAHPRFAMDREDLDDLVAWLKVMEAEPAPGVTDNAVRVGILYPSKGPLAEAAGEVRALLSGGFREANATGGLFNRRLELVEIPFDPRSPGETSPRRGGRWKGRRCSASWPTSASPRTAMPRASSPPHGFPSSSRSSPPRRAATGRTGTPSTSWPA